MKKLLAMFLVLGMILSMSVVFSACSTNDQAGGGNATAIVGEWEGEVDLADMFNAVFAEDSTLGGYIEIDSFELLMTFEFEEDGSAQASIDEDSFEDAFDDFLEDMIDGMEDYFEDVLEAAGSDMSVDEYLEAETGMSLREYVEELAEDMVDMDSVAESFAAGGKYLLEGEKLYFSDEEGEIDKSTYIKIELSEKKLTFVEMVSDEEIPEAAKAMYEDLTFKRK